jgi:hypothetical protein
VSDYYKLFLLICIALKQLMMQVATRRKIGISMTRSGDRSIKVLVYGTDDPDKMKSRMKESRWKAIGHVIPTFIGIVLVGPLILYGQLFMQSVLWGSVSNSFDDTAVVTVTALAPQPKDELVWASYTMGEIWEHLNCDKVFEQGRPIHGQEIWKEMRELYTSIVGHEMSTVGSLDSDYNGFVQPYYVRHNQYGRGIYAGMDIPEGSLIWQNIRSAQFSDGASYREFVRRLRPDLACDVWQWSYVDYDNKINVDLDEGALCNDGEDEGNIDLDENRSGMLHVPPGIQLFATRNISKDEELLCNYDGFSSASWSDFGL